MFGHWIPMVTRPGKHTREAMENHLLIGKPWENRGKMVIYMENNHLSKVNQLFLWAMFNSYVTNYQRLCMGNVGKTMS